MELFYCEVPGGNFGDDLNLWLWDALLPGWRGWPSDGVLVGVGTILSETLLPAGRHKLVLGSGTGYGRVPDRESGLWDIRAVRGPRTARALGLPEAAAIADPAIMLPTLPEFADVAKTGERLFVPHHLSAAKYDWERICAGTGIVPLDPRGDARAVIRRLAGAREVIAESMHAAIIADAFRVPWRAVAISKTFNDFKWGDWADSLGIDLQVTRFYATLRRIAAVRRRRAAPTTAGAGVPHGEERFPPAMRTILSIAARRTLRRLPSGGQLSADAALAARRTAFRAMLDRVTRDYAGGSMAT